MTITEWLRERCLTRVITSPVGDKPEPHDELVVTEWSSIFEKLMRNRLLLGRFRYGRMHDPEKGRYDNIGSAIERLKAYQEDGNLEHLPDVANLCLVEFECGKHPKRHFSAGDDTEHGRRLRATRQGENADEK